MKKKTDIFDAIIVVGKVMKNNMFVVDNNPSTNKYNLSADEMLKHMTLTYKLVGSRIMSHQVVRHRRFSFSQESQRYCNYGKKGLQIILPPEIAKYETTLDNWRDSVDKSYDIYNELLASGVPPEDARSVLPNCTKTEIVMTGTLADWKHVFEHRANNPKAQWEIRQIMSDIQEHARKLVPNVFM